MKEVLCNFLVWMLQYLQKKFLLMKTLKKPKKVASNQSSCPNGPKTEIPYHQKTLNAELGISNFVKVSTFKCAWWHIMQIGEYSKRPISL